MIMLAKSADLEFLGCGQELVRKISTDYWKRW